MLIISVFLTSLLELVQEQILSLDHVDVTFASSQLPVQYIMVQYANQSSHFHIIIYAIFVHDSALVLVRYEHKLFM